MLQDHGGLRRWHAECLDALNAIPGCEVVGIAERTSQYDRGERVNLPYGIAGTLRRLPLPPLMRIVQPPKCLKGIPRRACTVTRDRHREIFAQRDIEWIKGHSPTIILRFGFGIISGDILNTAPQGVWSFHHGDVECYRGRPPTFWEVLNGESRVGITLQRLNERLDAGEVLAKGFVTMQPLAPRGTLDRLYRCSAVLLRRSVLQLQREGAIRSTLPLKLGPIYRMPRSRDWLRYSWIVVRNAWTWIAEKSFFEMSWRIGILDTPPPLSGANEISPRWLEHSSHSFLADPCLLPGRSDCALVEHFDFLKGYGRIDLIALPSVGSSLTRIGTSLDTGRHLSFPQAYAFEGQTWLVPESTTYGMQLAYLLDERGRAMPDSRRTIEGLTGVDPIIFSHDGLWWAFTSPGGSRGSHLLNAFYASSFLGPYKAHSLNPIVLDSRGARPAGPMLRRDGELFRFGQAQGRYYGEGIEIFRIATLNPEEFTEEHVGSLRLKSIPGRATGTHGIAFIGEIAVVDGYEMKFSLTAGVARLWARVRRRASAVL